MKRVVDEQNCKHQRQSHTCSAEEMKQIIDRSISLFCMKIFMHMLIKASLIPLRPNIRVVNSIAN